MCNKISSYLILNYTYPSIVQIVKKTLTVHATRVQKMSNVQEHFVMMDVRKMS